MKVRMAKATDTHDNRALGTVATGHDEDNGRERNKTR
jgi:hypothetical protein